jgi:4-carboxymuconolactone decarboxylase
VNDGATEIEIRETLLQTATYSGIPTGMLSFRVADAAIKKLKEEGKLP